MNWKSSTFIGVCSIAIFIVIAIGVVISSMYMNQAIMEEEDAEVKRAEYKQLGENLADASDYLTEEVRKYAATGEIEHLYNYWYEIYVNRERDAAIEIFEQSNPPDQEKALLEEAKEQSDYLVGTETLSMKLVLLSRGENAETYADTDAAQYVELVMEYELPDEYMALSEEEMKAASISLLFDANYEECKNEIMTPIVQFQELMNERMDREVEARKEQTRAATAIQIGSAVIELIVIAALIQVMSRLYLAPLKNYTKEIAQAGLSDAVYEKADNRNVRILDAKIIPYGAQELVHFANAYNHMLDMFYQELCHRKNAEENMRRARNEAQTANRAKGIFFAQMSHELRTPLNAVNGYTFLLEQTELTSKQAEYTENIRNSSEGLLELINQILDFSKIDAGKLEFEEAPFSVQKTAETIRQILNPQAKEKNLSLELKTDPQIPAYVYGDALRLRQVLMNLTGNAIKFTECGGVTIEICRCGEHEQKGTQEFCTLYFSVRDTGIGVAEEAKERIFQPFVQSDASITRKYGGTGLGLPICSQIIALAGNKTHRLELDSKEGEGSDFHFTMDYRIAADYEEQSDMCPVLPDCTGKKILIVDDSKVNLQVQKEMLEICGAEVFTKESGNAALLWLQAGNTADLILMDIRMPVMDGYETTGRIRQIPSCREIPVIALTADALDEVRQQAMTAGMSDCLLKPVQQKELFEALKTYLQIEKTVSIQQEVRGSRTARPEEGRLFDEECCLAHLSGNVTSLEQLMEIFLLLHGKDDEQLLRLIREKEYDEAEAMLHLLKGVAGNLCCRPLVTEGENLRRELKAAKGKDNAVVTGEKYLSIWKLTINEIEEACQKYKRLHKDAEDPDGREKNCGQEGSDTSVQEAERIFREMLELCESYDTEAVRYLEQYRGLFRKNMAPDAYALLKNYSMQYNFPGMRKVLLEVVETQKERRGEDVSCYAGR